jgi:hypothetical protein
MRARSSSESGLGLRMAAVLGMSTIVEERCLANLRERVAQSLAQATTRYRD